MVSNGLQMDKNATIVTFPTHLQTVSGTGSTRPGTVPQLPGRAALDQAQLQPLRPADCINKQPSLDSCSALFAYRAPVDGWIQDLKFAQDLATARLLGSLLASRITPDDRERPALVLPVPLHRKRLAERGYNQALEIARSLTQKDYQLDPCCCQRHRATSAQSNLPASVRKQNVHNAFSVSRLPVGAHVLLIDDVMTTGATLNELARTLKRAGADRVEAWVIARTGHKSDGTF
jgi:ComF family protein